MNLLALLINSRRGEFGLSQRALVPQAANVLQVGVQPPQLAYANWSGRKLPKALVTAVLAPRTAITTPTSLLPPHFKHAHHPDEAAAGGGR